jgi:hypothetical protein
MRRCKGLPVPTAKIYIYIYILFDLVDGKYEELQAQSTLNTKWGDSREVGLTGAAFQRAPSDFVGLYEVRHAI